MILIARYFRYDFD